MWNIFGTISKNRPAKGRIYLDYASATPVLPEAARATALAEQFFGNPGSIHAEGVVAAKLLKGSREKLAHKIGCKPRDIVFTSGGSEANNLAILGFARKLELNSFARGHWIVSAIEHPSALECFGEVERLGGKVSFVDPDKHGVIRPEAIAQLLRPETVFVSIGWANGEIGVIQPLARIARVLRAHEAIHQSTIIFHTDAGQAPLYEAAHVSSLGIDMLTLDSGKLYGPRGIGALYLNDRVQLSALQLGGKQEHGLRAGTENVALAAGFAEAFAVIARERREESKRLKELQQYFVSSVRERITGAIINGEGASVLPHIVNISIPDINSEYVTLALDHAGIALSTKSACREGEEQKSHVVEALLSASAADEWRSKNTLRISFGRMTVKKDLQLLIDALCRLVK